MEFLKNKPFVIADVGSNFRKTGSEKENRNIALKQIECAAQAGVNAVKFQLYTHKELYGYDGDDTYALPKTWLPDLADKCRFHGVEFMCTAFSPEGVEIVNEFVNIHKIASSDMKYVDLRNKIIETKKPMIISTGSAHYDEVESLINFMKCEGIHNYCLMECVAAYPANPADYNLSWLREWNGGAIECGISDHTLTNTVATVAIGLGATVFEKHFDNFKDHGPTPDSIVSINGEKMREYIGALKDAVLCTKERAKRPCKAEDDMQLIHRRRIMATKDIAIGEPLELNWNFGAFRSKIADYRGAPADIVHQLDGKTAKVEIRKGDSIWLDDLNG